MKKILVRTALVASFALAAVSLTACGSNDGCANTNSGTEPTSSAATAAPAMFPMKGKGGGGSGKSSSKSKSGSKGLTKGLTGGNTGGYNGTRGGGFVMPYWFGGPRTSSCRTTSTPAPSSIPNP